MSSLSSKQRLLYVQRAAQTLQEGAWAEAQMLLMTVLDPDAQPSEPDQVTFVALRLLGQLTRQRGDLPRARDIYRAAGGLAQTLGRADLESAALEGLATVAQAESDPEQAISLLRAAEQKAHDAGDELGRAAVVGNLGQILSEMRRFEEAERPLREALGCKEMPGHLRAIWTDNLAIALAGLGRLDEAIELGRQAADAFAAANMPVDRYKALRNVENHEVLAGNTEAARAAFGEIFELIHKIAADGVIEAHYAAFPQRVAEIEANTSRHLGREQNPAETALRIGIGAVMGDRMGNAGDIAMEQARYAEAERAYLQALAFWEDLRALHMLPRINFALGTLYTEVGQLQEALTRLVLARDQAHALGDAFREESASANLCRLVLDAGDRTGGLDELELLAQARALHPLAVRQLFGSEVLEKLAAEDAAKLADAGVLDALEATICMRHDAPEMAERALHRAIAELEPMVQEKGGELFRYRLVLRLTKLYIVLREQDKTEEAVGIARRLDELVAEGGNPRAALAVNSTLGLELFERGGDLEATLARLTAACDAFEALRREAAVVGTLESYSELARTPFHAAIEVALELGHTEAAFSLLERSKARSLLDALRTHSMVAGDPESASEAQLYHELQSARAEFDHVDVNEEPADRARRLMAATERIEELEPKLEQLWAAMGESNPEVVAHRLATPATAQDVIAELAKRGDDAVVIELFVGPRTVQAFSLDAQGSIHVHHLSASDAGGWPELAELVRRSTGSAGEFALAAVAQPALRAVSTLTQRVAGERPVFLIPHRFLHALPLHLIEDGPDSLAARPGTFHLPSASLLRYAATAQMGTSVLVGGDPLEDLPFAYLEATDTAGHFGAPVVTGAACTPNWLAECLEGGHDPLGLLHLACHAVFDPHRVEHSGIVLASDGQPHVFELAELARLDWTSGLTVLSACSSGQQTVRDGDELAGLTATLLVRGAGAVILALWEVPDLPTQLLFESFYDRLGAGPPWSLEAIGNALAGAQRTLRDLTARELIAKAAQMHAQAEARQDPKLERCARLAVARGHGAAGNEAWERWAAAAAGEGQAPLTAADWADLEARAMAVPYSIQPFVEVENWAGFSVLGCG
jgi:CHAT domain-containing protein/tetratricopeptide (TPR) repeat protein